MGDRIITLSNASMPFQYLTLEIHSPPVDG
jgi:hypothetical protein